MQEDVENKSVNLAVKSTKVTASVLYKALKGKKHKIVNGEKIFEYHLMTKERDKNY